MPRSTLARAPATLSRRESIRLSASLSAAALAGAVIRPRRAAAQTPNTAHTVIVFRPSHAENGAVVTEAYTAALEPFRSKNPSVEVQFDWVLRAGSMWIGLAASAHNGDFGGKGYIRAAFDHVSFEPSAAYQIRASGIPPAAGAIPAGWATAVRAG